MEDLGETDRLNLLIHLHDKTRQEVDFLRDRQDKIFSWSSGILMALIGALLIVEPSGDSIWSPQFEGKLILSMAVFALVAFSVVWQQSTRRYQGESGQVIVRIERLMHCYDKGYFDSGGEVVLFPTRWNKPPEKEIPRFAKRVFAANYVSATILFGVLAIAMIWLRG